MAVEAQEEHKQELRGQQSQEAAVPPSLLQGRRKEHTAWGGELRGGLSKKFHVCLRGRDSETLPSAPSIGWLTLQMPTS